MVQNWLVAWDAPLYLELQYSASLMTQDKEKPHVKSSYDNWPSYTNVTGLGKYLMDLMIAQKWRQRSNLIRKICAVDLDRNRTKEIGKYILSCCFSCLSKPVNMKGMKLEIPNGATCFSKSLSLAEATEISLEQLRSELLNFSSMKMCFILFTEDKMKLNNLY